MPDEIISLGLGGGRTRQRKGEAVRPEASSGGAGRRATVDSSDGAKASSVLGVASGHSDLGELVAEAVSSAETVQRDAGRFKDAGGQVGFITTHRINAAVRNAQDAYDAAASMEEDSATLFAEKANRSCKESDRRPQRR